MLNFRQFEAGPDPFGHTWQVLFKWMQTAIALRHSDTVDVKFLLECEGERTEKTIAMPHPGLLDLSRREGVEMSDAWCSRLAALHLRRMVATGEDMDKEIAQPGPAELAAYAAELAAEEKQEVETRVRGTRP